MRIVVDATVEAEAVKGALRGDPSASPQGAWRGASIGGPSGTGKRENSLSPPRGIG